MFGTKLYHLGIPVQENVCNKLQEAVINIIKKEEFVTLESTNQLLEIKGEYHVTIGIFHGSITKTQRAVFRDLVHYLQKNRTVYDELKNLFRGHCRITGIGYDGHDIKHSQVVWASVETPELENIRTRVHQIMRAAGIDENHFRFTDPHITLFTIKPHKDRHNINKHAKIHLNEVLQENHLDFPFTGAYFKRGFKTMGFFGSGIQEGKTTHKFKKILAEAKNT